MKSCDLVQDLLPLYVEGLTRPESTAMVEDHLRKCAECRQLHQSIRRDYQQHERESPQQEQLDRLVSQLARYQRNIKLAVVLVAMLMSCIFVGAEVEGMSTLPWIILTPFVGRLFYPRSLPILLSAIPFGLLGGVLSHQNSSYIPFFAVVVFISTALGILAAILVKLAWEQSHLWRKSLALVPGVALVVAGCMAFFSFYGNPIGYVEAMVKTNRYVAQTYEEGTLTFQGVTYNFKDNRHYGRFAYVLEGIRQEASIHVGPDYTYDGYHAALEMRFADERSRELQAVLETAARDEALFITASPVEKLEITRDDLDHQYYLLTYDPARREQAAERRVQEQGKLQYQIRLAPFGQIDITREELVRRALHIQRTMQDRGNPYASVELSATDSTGRLHQVTFTRQSTEQDITDSYEVITK